MAQMFSTVDNKKSLDHLIIEDLKTKQVNLEAIISQMQQ